MKCQFCNKPATHHVTDIAADQAVEYHVCDTHIRDLDSLSAVGGPPRPRSGFGALFEDLGIGKALVDPHARERMAGYLLPALCLALLDQQPAVKIVAAVQMMKLGHQAQSAAEALRDALRDHDENVRKAAAIALEHIEANEEPFLF